MAASDELPRGLTLAAIPGGSGTQSAVIFPAAPGIAWVLTTINAVLAAFGGSTNALPEITANAIQFGWLAGVLPANTTSEFSWTGQITFPVNTAVVVQFSAGLVNGVESLNAEAYPI